MNKIYLFLLWICLTTTVQAQTLKQYQKAALKAFIEQDYLTALNHYSLLLQVDSTNVNNHYKRAESARNFSAYKIAETAYQTVSTSTQRGEFPLTDYWLAGVKKSLGKYDEAKTLYERFLINNPNAEEEYRLKAQTEVDNYNWVMNTAGTTTEGVKIIHLGEEVNTPYSEVSPFVVNDKLYYTSFRYENDEDEHYPFRPISKLHASTDGEMGMLLDGTVNVEEKHTAHATFNRTGDQMYYTICDYVQHTNIPCAIYAREVTGDGWGTIQKLPATINLEGYTATHPNIAYDKASGEERLYFVSDRPEGKGGTDIWYSVMNEGTWSDPINLATINTSGDEISPFHHAASNTLYFSTNGRKNLGGYDIYKSEYREDKWNEPTHMGFPINSSYNDLHYIVNEEETEAYFASNRLESFYLKDAEEACCNDIYRAELNPMNINLIALTFNKATRNPLNGVDLQFLEEVEIVAEDNHEDDNEYRYEGKRNKKYAFIASKLGYAPDTVYLSTMDITTSTDITKELYLDPYRLDLIALTFVDNEEKPPLLGATVHLTDCEGNILKNITYLDKNDYFFQTLDIEGCYKLNVSAPEHYPASVDVSLPELLTSSVTLEEKIYLKPKPVTKETLDKYLPLPLYFDNDQPDSRTTRVYTNKTYDQTARTYIARQPEFRQEFSKGLTSELAIRAETAVDEFFVEVRMGADTLENFTSYLIRYLDQGNTAEIMIRGFASPLAGSRYNKNLTKRRISSVLNYFKRYSGGAMDKYVASGQLKVTEVPHGELLASEAVSDRIEDRKNSIFSPAASRERRVEIIEIRAEEDVPQE